MSRFDKFFAALMFIFLIGMSGCSSNQVTRNDATVAAPPPALNLPPFYKKYFLFRGIPIVGSGAVRDVAFYEAAHLSGVMLEHRPDLLSAMLKNKIRIAIIGAHEEQLDLPEAKYLLNTPLGLGWNQRARGLGATIEVPISSVGEENLLCLKGDRYKGENIFIHEFTHSIHLLGIKTTDPKLADEITRAYKHAMKEGLWKNTYAWENEQEYLAEGAQSWFSAGRPGPKGGDGVHNEIVTQALVKSYDPLLASVLTQIFSDSEWIYSCPAN